MYTRPLATAGPEYPSAIGVDQTRGKSPLGSFSTMPVSRQTRSRFGPPQPGQSSARVGRSAIANCKMTANTRKSRVRIRKIFPCIACDFLVLEVAAANCRRALSVRQWGDDAHPIQILCGLALALAPVVAFADDPGLTELEAKHLSNLRQVTFGLPRAGEGYFSPDGQLICYQAYPVGYPFYQIYIQRLDERDGPPHQSGTRPHDVQLLFPRRQKVDFRLIAFRPEHGRDRTTGTRRGGPRRTPPLSVEFRSAHGNLRVESRRIGNQGRSRIRSGYDAEGSFSADGKHIVFTSTRNGNPNLYIMNADGSNVRQLTHQPAYNGGPFFSPDDKWVIFRSDRKKKDMLQLYAISADGKHEVELTNNLDTVNWAPYFHPSGKYIVYTMADYAHGPRGATYDLYTMEIEHDDTHFKGAR